MKRLCYVSIALLLFSCSATKNNTASTQNAAVATQLQDHQTFLLTEISKDPAYGFSNKKPIEVGGADKSEGPMNERRFLNALAGPNGEKVSYYRAGSCCPVDSKNGFMGKAMLDNYRVTWEGSKDTVSIYINMYDYGVLKAPAGFTIKQ
jgi:hypothetical protein